MSAGQCCFVQGNHAVLQDVVQLHTGSYARFAELLIPTVEVEEDLLC
jgi:hypothetical protein